MPRGGHNRKPSRLKAVQGTLRKDRANPNAPKLVRSNPSPSRGLVLAAKREFMKLVAILDEMGILARGDCGELENLEGKNPDHIKSEDYRNNLGKSYERKQLVRAAIEKQKQIITQERIIVSKELVKKVGPKYTDIVKRLALQYIALAEIIVEEINLREALNDEDIPYQVAGLRPMPLKFGDDPREDASRFAIWIKECVEYGYLSDRDVPKQFKDSWRKSGGFEFKNTALAAIVTS